MMVEVYYQVRTTTGNFLLEDNNHVVVGSIESQHLGDERMVVWVSRNGGNSVVKELTMDELTPQVLSDMMNEVGLQGVVT